MKREGAHAVVRTRRNDVQTALTTPIVQHKLVIGVSRCLVPFPSLILSCCYNLQRPKLRPQEVLSRVYQVAKTVCRRVIDYNIESRARTVEQDVAVTSMNSPPYTARRTHEGEINSTTRPRPNPTSPSPSPSSRSGILYAEIPIVPSPASDARGTRSERWEANRCTQVDMPQETTRNS